MCTKTANIFLVPVDNVYFFLLFDDNYVPTLFHIPRLPLHRHWQHTHTNAPIYCGAHCSVEAELVAGLALLGTWIWEKKKRKTTSWNLSAPSYSVFIVLASCSAAARHPGRFSWSSWMLAAAPPLATSLSAPSSSVFIVLGRGASAVELAQPYRQHTD